MQMKAILSFLLMAVLLETVLFTLKQEEKYEYLFQYPLLSIEIRVNDLVSRLTLEEKVAQMLNSAPAIERLGIPSEIVMALQGICNKVGPVPEGCNW